MATHPGRHFFCPKNRIVADLPKIDTFLVTTALYQNHADYDYRDTEMAALRSHEFRAVRVRKRLAVYWSAFSFFANTPYMRPVQIMRPG